MKAELITNNDSLLAYMSHPEELTQMSPQEYGDELGIAIEKFLEGRPNITEDEVVDQIGPELDMAAQAAS